MTVGQLTFWSVGRDIRCTIETPAMGDMPIGRGDGATLFGVEIWPAHLEWPREITIENYRTFIEMDKFLKPIEVTNRYVGGLRLWRGWSMVRVSPAFNYSSDPMDCVDGSDPGLWSVSAGSKWEYGVQEAHDVPQMRKQHVGFYGFYGIRGATHQMGITTNVKRPILGSYIGWGRCVVAKLGVRTQFAKLECLVEAGGPTDPVALRIATDYGVPLISMDAALELKSGLVPFTEEMK